MRTLIISRKSDRHLTPLSHQNRAGVASDVCRFFFDCIPRHMAVYMKKKVLGFGCWVLGTGYWVLTISTFS